jgi:hypothetical protein
VKCTIQLHLVFSYIRSLFAYWHFERRVYSEEGRISRQYMVRQKDRIYILKIIIKMLILVTYNDLKIFIGFGEHLAL